VGLKKILVVDDNAVVLKALSMKLTSAGYEVSVAEDCGKAISTARATRPDVILLDISFPPNAGAAQAWDGFLILSWLRRLEVTKNTPVIMVSQDRSAEAQQRARAAGAVEFCPKPINLAHLLSALEHLVGTPVAG
jgi:CheY-like chemotaxis protein